MDVVGQFPIIYRRTRLAAENPDSLGPPFPWVPGLDSSGGPTGVPQASWVPAADTSFPFGFILNHIRVPCHRFMGFVYQTFLPPQHSNPFHPRPTRKYGPAWQPSRAQAEGLKEESVTRTAAPAMRLPDRPRNRGRGRAAPLPPHPQLLQPEMGRLAHSHSGTTEVEVLGQPCNLLVIWRGGNFLSRACQWERFSKFPPRGSLRFYIMTSACRAPAPLGPAPLPPALRRRAALGTPAGPVRAGPCAVPPHSPCPPHSRPGPGEGQLHAGRGRRSALVPWAAQALAGGA